MHGAKAQTHTGKEHEQALMRHSLSGLASKAKGRVTRIEGGHDMHSRMAGMGIIPGIEVEVVRNDVHGPMVVVVNRTRIVLGRGMAEKVLIA